MLKEGGPNESLIKALKSESTSTTARLSKQPTYDYKYYESIDNNSKKTNPMEKSTTPNTFISGKYSCDNDKKDAQKTTDSDNTVKFDFDVENQNNIRNEEKENKPKEIINMIFKEEQEEKIVEKKEEKKVFKKNERYVDSILDHWDKTSEEKVAVPKVEEKEPSITASITKFSIKDNVIVNNEN